MFVTVYEESTGIIRDCLEISNSSDAPLQAQDGESWVEGLSDPHRQVIVNGSIQDKPAAEIESYEIEQAWVSLRRERDQRLQATDWTQVPDAPADAQAWATYRQALRDLPQNTTDPREVVWPEPPA